MTILITGVAGFIGSHLASKMLSQNFNVIGIDNLNDYYSVNLKKYRLKQLNKFKNFTFIKADLSKALNLEKIIKKKKLSVICHLAAQAGVRYSITNPSIYLKYNIDGFLNILEYCRRYNTNLVYASSSSVYGANKKVPFSVNDDVSNPVSLYAVTKRSNELMAESYFNLYKLNSIGLRFFTVYGPFGRPDMAYFSFTNALTKKKIITLNNEGKMYRDMTYIEDIVDGIIGAINYAMNSNNKIRNEIFNLGNDKPIKTTELLGKIESYFNQRAKTNIEYTENESLITHADITKAKNLLGYDPKVSFEEGIKIFLDWHKHYENL